MIHVTQIFAVSLACLTLASCVQTQDCSKGGCQDKKPATVPATEARASKWGFDAHDSTLALEAALASKVQRLVIDKMPTPWITARPLKVPSDMEIIFEEGVELQAKRGAFKGINDSLLTLGAVKNVTIKGLGKGATLKMHKKDYLSDAYKKAEWRHCIQLFASDNILIENLRLVESGGDGIYLGVGSNKTACSNVVIRNVICDGNNRQGLSIIGGVDCLIEDCQFINTWGTPPAAGVDFEPNRPGERLDNIVLRNCISRNNQGCGYDFYLVNSTAESGKLNITLDNCTSSGEQASPFCFTTLNGLGYERPGQVLVKNCTFENNKNPVIFSGSSANGFKTVFENVTLRDIATGNDAAPIRFGYATSSTGTAGNIVFKNVNVYDSKDRDPFFFTNGGLAGGLENINGTITSYLNGKKNRVLTLTDEWARKTYPKRDIKVIPPLDITKMAFIPATPDAKVSNAPFSPIRIRGTGIWNIYAKAGDTLKLTAAYDQLARYEGVKAPVTLKTPSGKDIPLGDIPFKKSKDFEYTSLPETGLYTLSIKAGNTLCRIVHCNLPIVLRAYPHPIHLCAGTGYLYFYVPAGTKEFAVQFTGEGNEGLKGTVYGPDGKQLWQMDDISRLEQYDCTGELALKGGIFKISIALPTHLPALEDHFISLTGVPSIFGLAPELLLKEKK